MRETSPPEPGTLDGIALPRPGLLRLLKPRSIAVIGASRREGAVGRILVDNILAGGFEGTVYAINPHPLEVPGAVWLPSVSALPAPPDLALIATPAREVPRVVKQLGMKAARIAVVLSAGLSGGSQLGRRMLATARAQQVSLIGPNCLGLILPHARLNGSFAHIGAAPGGLAFLSQSGALATAMLDWAAGEGLGFSAILSMGDMADVDFADMIALLAEDQATRAILLYIEGIADAPRFLAAARRAAAVKPVIALKAGRTSAAGKAALSHTGALAGSYDVYAAALRRAGVVLVEQLTDLFGAAEVLSRSPPARGDRLAIVTNGGGAGILAVDALPAAGARLAQLSPETIAALDDQLPAGWSRANPVDLVGDAPPARFLAAVRLLLADPEADALLVVHCPTALSRGAPVAAAVCEAVSAARGKPLIACWLGGPNADAAEPCFEQAGIPLFNTLEAAVAAIGHLLAVGPVARAAAEATPLSAPATEANAALDLFDAARRDGRSLLSEVEAKQLLQLYGVPTVATAFARTGAEVGVACRGLAPPYVVKLVSPDLTHKSDVGGVALDLPDAAAAATAATAMGDNVREHHPEARIDGFAVETMVRRPQAQEMIVGMSEDATFGPVLLVGAGGTAVEVLRDRAIELPPLTRDLARDMIARTRVAALLRGYRRVPPCDIEALADTLLALSRMAIELPDLVELDINPLLVDPAGVLALDARVRITPEPRQGSRAMLALSLQ